MLCGLALLISLDGFMWNYLDNFGLENFPNFAKFMEHGVKCHHLQNLFETKTFPNHHSIVTGLYEESHGIIHNNMFDPLLNETFETDNIESKWWDNGGEPIWVTNQKNIHSSKCLHKSAVYMWPGSLSKIKNIYPTYNMNFSEELSLQDKFKIVIDDFKQKRINLGIVYHFEPDHTGHLYGPHSIEVKTMIQNLDNDIGFLLNELTNLSLSNQVDIILTSDHGMTSVTKEKTVMLSEHIDLDNFIISGASPMYNLFSKNKTLIDLTFVNLNKANKSGFELYKKNDIPKKWHYQFNERIGDIIVVGNPGWNVALKEGEADLTFKGNHGYDNFFNESWPLFIARGPNFKKNYSCPPINNIDIYPLMCHLLGIQPAPNNGSFKHVSHLLMTEKVNLGLEDSLLNQPQNGPLSILTNKITSKHLLAGLFGTGLFLIVAWLLLLALFRCFYPQLNVTYSTIWSYFKMKTQPNTRNYVSLNDREINVGGNFDSGDEDLIESTPKQNNNNIKNGLKKERDNESKPIKRLDQIQKSSTSETTNYSQDPGNTTYAQERLLNPSISQPISSHSSALISFDND